MNIQGIYFVITQIKYITKKTFLLHWSLCQTGMWCDYAVPECAGILWVTVLLSRSHSRRSPDCPPHSTEFPSQQKHLEGERHTLSPFDFGWKLQCALPCCADGVTLPLLLLGFHRWDHHSRLDVNNLHTGVCTNGEDVSAIWGCKKHSHYIVISQVQLWKLVMLLCNF